MLPQLFCPHHQDQEIIMINLSKDCERNNRTLCAECMEDKQLKSLLPLKKLPLKTSEYREKKQKETQDSCLKEQQRIEQLITSIITLKQKSDNIFDNLVKECQLLIQWIQQQGQEQIKYSEKLLENLTNSKLEELADILGGGKDRNFIVDSLPNQYKTLTSTMQKEAKEINFDDLIRQIRVQENNKVIVQHKPQFFIEGKSYRIRNVHAVKINQLKSLIIIGSSKNIQVWQQNDYSLTQLAQFEGHTDDVTALEIYNSGDIIISGSKDKSLKLWQLKNQWVCYQTLFDHKGAITDVKLTANEDQVISCSADKTIKIWHNIQQSQILELFQTIAESYDGVLNFALTPTLMAMETKSWKNYIDLFQRTDSGKWKRLCTKPIEGRIKSLTFTEEGYLICQTIYPSKVVIYEKPEKLQKKQEIALQQDDHQLNTIAFPILQIENRLFLVHQRQIYVLLSDENYNYTIEYIMQKNLIAGCLDVTGTCLLGQVGAELFGSETFVFYHI